MRPGAYSRRGEVKEIESVIRNRFNNIEAIEAPGTLEGGDIMMVGNHYYIGLSNRTNLEGARQIIKIINKYGMSGSTISLNENLHLKTGLAYLENNNLVVSGEFINNAIFERYNSIEIPKIESYAANCIWINGSVIIPTGYPVTKEKIMNAGYLVIETDVSEFQKLDGGISCLSLRY
jgi:dimethylargininase